MSARRLALLGLLFAAALASAGGAHAERLVISLSHHRIQITSNFTGTELILFASIERDAASVARSGSYDVVVTATGPREAIVTRHKQRVFGIWINTASRTLLEAPSYLAVRSNRPLAEILGPEPRRQFRIGLDEIAPKELANGAVTEMARGDPFREAFIRLKRAQGLFRERDNAITFLTPHLFRTSIPLPANAPIGTYEVDVKLIADGVIIARETSAFEIVKVGFEQFVANAAQEHGTLYGLVTTAMALFIGLIASAVFRRD
jgi:uncharacterized protein (TIGR02186 family)